MKSYANTPQAIVTENILKIMNDRHLTQSALVDVLGIDSSNIGKLLQNRTQLTFNSLAKIADFFAMSATDLINYPDVYVKQHPGEPEPVEATLQIKLRKEKKDQVLKLVFGENNLEILNK